MGLNKFKKVTIVPKSGSENTFKESLSEGKKVERIALDLLKIKYPTAYIVDGKFKEFDIFVPETGDKIEVKADYVSKATGKFTIEVKMNDKPSGLITSKADFWMLYDGAIMIKISKKDICDIILLNGIPAYTFKGGTDTTYKSVYFVPIESLKEKAIEIINIV